MMIMLYENRQIFAPLRCMMAQEPKNINQGFDFDKVEGNVGILGSPCVVCTLQCNYPVDGL